MKAFIIVGASIAGVAAIWWVTSYVLDSVTGAGRDTLPANANGPMTAGIPKDRAAPVKPGVTVGTSSPAGGTRIPGAAGVTSAFVGTDEGYYPSFSKGLVTA